jgi:anti-sigma-K factor RskA
MPESGPANIDMKVDASHDITIAVSLEPVGGSPTGTPTGPVLYSGKMIPTTRS